MRSTLLATLLAFTACHHHASSGNGSDGFVTMDGGGSDGSTIGDGGGSDAGSSNDGGLAHGDPTETIPGTGWSIAHDGLYGATVNQVLRSAANPDVVYSLAMGGWLARSDDRGATWQMMHHFVPWPGDEGIESVQSIAVDPHAATRLWVAIEKPDSVILRSDDGGKS